MSAEIYIRQQLGADPDALLRSLRRPLDPARIGHLLTAEKPTGESLAAVLDLFRALDFAGHGPALQMLFRAAAHPWICQLGLLWCWKASIGARNVAAAAGSREDLKRWFRHSRFDWPCSEEVAEVVTVWAPRQMTLYRGGRGDPRALAAEYSWTPYRAIAAKYAAANPHPSPDADGSPVILRRHVRRSDIALKWVHADQETVLLDPGPFEVDSTDPDVIGDMLPEAAALFDKHEKERAAFMARHRLRGAQLRGTP